MKHCTKCGNEKALSEYYTDNRAQDKRSSICKACAVTRYKDSAEMRERARDSHLRKKYGITIIEFNALSENQGHKCAICGIDSIYTEHSKLCVDHNHATGEVRALLCKKCNHAIGLLQDSPQFCHAAGDYLTAHS